MLAFSKAFTYLAIRFCFVCQVSRVELLDEVQIRAINIANGKNLPETPTLMLEFIGTGEFEYFESVIND